MKKIQRSIFLLLLFYIMTSVSSAEVTSIDAPIPAKPSAVPDKLLGIPRQEWKILSANCRRFDVRLAVSKEMGFDEWGNFVAHSTALHYWRNCLKEIDQAKHSIQQ